MYREYKLTSDSQNSLNTEIRYTVASAKADGIELLNLVVATSNNEDESARIFQATIKVLKAMKRDESIQFYHKSESIGSDTTEASFLLNKYGSYITGSSLHNSIYVKL